MQVVMRSYNAARSGANLSETVLTPRKVGANLLVSDAGVNAAVFRLDSDFFTQVSIDKTTVTAAARSSFEH